MIEEIKFKCCLGAIMLTTTMLLVGYSAAQELDSLEWTTYECTPRFAGSSNYEMLTMRKLSFSFDQESFDEEINPDAANFLEGFQGFASLNIDGIEGTGAYKTYGIMEIFGSIINGINYVAMLEGSVVSLYETGDPLVEVETGTPEYVRLIETFTCKKVDTATHRIEN